jgi:ketosteroid isomerase-like protein
MSQEKVDVIRRGYAAYRQDDLESLEAIVRDVIDPDFELHAVFAERVFTGPEGMREFFSELREVWKDYVNEPEEFIDLGEHVVVVSRLSARGSSSGVPVRGRLVALWTFKDDKLFRARFLRSRREALEAAGLRE